MRESRRPTQYHGRSERMCSLALITVGLLLPASAALGAADVGPPVVEHAPLAAGVSEFELGLGGAARHPVTLEAGQLLQVEVRERGPRIVLTLLDEKGATLARREAPADTLTTLRLRAVAPAGGAFALEVRSSRDGRAGRYEIVMEEPRPAAERERALVAGDDALAEAVRLSSESPADARRRALARLEAAEEAFQEAGDRPGQALVLLKRGRLQFDSGQPAAAETLEESIRLFREVGDGEGEGAALVGLGATRLRTGDLEAARALFETAAQRARAIDSRLILAASLNSIGITFGRSGHGERAVELFTEALSVAREAGSVRGQAQALNGLGVTYGHLGDPQKALQSYERALSLSRAGGSGDAAVAILGNIGNAHIALGDNDRALTFLEEACSLRRRPAWPRRRPAASTTWRRSSAGAATTSERSRSAGGRCR